MKSNLQGVHWGRYRRGRYSTAMVCFFVGILLQGCREPQGQSLATPDYSMLGRCERPSRSQLISVVSESLCGTIEVYENRELASGRRIPLNIMVMPSISKKPKPDPIFFLAGGPGQAATEAGPMLFYVLSELREERDIVLVDQRGTGKSNPLDCESNDEELQILDLTLKELNSLSLDLMRECLSNYDADPSQYTTPVSMDDLNEVRKTLGFEKINIIGMSYGTRAALVYLRRHEDTVRSLILDGVAPLNMKISANIAIDAQNAMERLFADCESEPNCALAFPHIRAHFNQLMARLRDSPETISYTHPTTGERFEGRIASMILTRMIRSILYDRTLSSLLPLAIEEAYMGYYQPLLTMGFSFTAEDMGMSSGLMSSILCSEDMTITQSANDENLDFDNAVYHLLEGVCQFWPVGNIPQDYFEPVHSQVPTLLVSGTLDPVTPPGYAAEAMRTLPNSTHLVIPGVGHGSIIHGCVPELLHQFIDNPDPGAVDATCIIDMKRPPFFTSLAGPVAIDTVNSSAPEPAQIPASGTEHD